MVLKKKNCFSKILMFLLKAQTPGPQNIIFPKVPFWTSLIPMHTYKHTRTQTRVHTSTRSSSPLWVVHRSVESIVKYFLILFWRDFLPKDPSKFREIEYSAYQCLPPPPLSISDSEFTTTVVLKSSTHVCNVRSACVRALACAQHLCCPYVMLNKALDQGLFR